MLFNMRKSSANNAEEEIESLCGNFGEANVAKRC